MSDDETHHRDEVVSAGILGDGGSKRKGMFQSSPSPGLALAATGSPTLSSLHDSYGHHTDDNASVDVIPESPLALPVGTAPGSMSPPLDPAPLAVPTITVTNVSMRAAVVSTSPISVLGQPRESLLASTAASLKRPRLDQFLSAGSGNGEADSLHEDFSSSSVVGLAESIPDEGSESDAEDNGDLTSVDRSSQSESKSRGGAVKSTKYRAESEEDEEEEEEEEPEEYEDEDAHGEEYHNDEDEDQHYDAQWSEEDEDEDEVDIEDGRLGLKPVSALRAPPQPFYSSFSQPSSSQAFVRPATAATWQPTQATSGLTSAASAVSKPKPIESDSDSDLIILDDSDDEPAVSTQPTKPVPLESLDAVESHAPKPEPVTGSEAKPAHEATALEPSPAEQPTPTTISPANCPACAARKAARLQSTMVTSTYELPPDAPKDTHELVIRLCQIEARAAGLEEELAIARGEARMAVEEAAAEKAAEVRRRAALMNSLRKALEEGIDRRQESQAERKAWFAEIESLHTKLSQAAERETELARELTEAREQASQARMQSKRVEMELQQAKDRAQIATNQAEEALARAKQDGENMLQRLVELENEALSLRQELQKERIKTSRLESASLIVDAGLRATTSGISTSTADQLSTTEGSPARASPTVGQDIAERVLEQARTIEQLQRQQRLLMKQLADARRTADRALVLEESLIDANSVRAALDAKSIELRRTREKLQETEALVNQWISALAPLVLLRSPTAEDVDDPSALNSGLPVLAAASEQVSTHAIKSLLDQEARCLARESQNDLMVAYSNDDGDSQKTNKDDLDPILDEVSKSLTPADVALVLRNLYTQHLALIASQTALEQTVKDHLQRIANLEQTLKEAQEREVQAQTTITKLHRQLEIAQKREGLMQRENNSLSELFNTFVEEEKLRSPITFEAGQAALQALSASVSQIAQKTDTIREEVTSTLETLKTTLTQSGEEDVRNVVEKCVQKIEEAVQRSGEFAAVANGIESSVESAQLSAMRAAESLVQKHLSLCQTLEKQLDDARAHIHELEQRLAAAPTMADIEALQQRLEESERAREEVEGILNELREKEAEEAELRPKPDFDPATTKVLHLKASPIEVAHKVEIERRDTRIQDLEREVGRLRSALASSTEELERVAMQAVGTSMTTTPISTVGTPQRPASGVHGTPTSSIRTATAQKTPRSAARLLRHHDMGASGVPTAAELAELRDRVARLSQALTEEQKRAKRLRDVFAERALALREGIASLTGFHVEMNQDEFVLRPVLSTGEDDVLAFARVSPDDTSDAPTYAKPPAEGLPRLEIKDTVFVHSLPKTLLKAFYKSRSIPFLLSGVYLYLHQRRVPPTTTTTSEQLGAPSTPRTV